MGEGIVAFSTDDKPQFVYEPFNQGRDFGPLDIARTVMYCRWVEALCNAHTGCSALVHVVSDTSGRDRANTVALCGAFLVLYCGLSAEDAFRPFAQEPLPPFVDCRGEAAPGSEISEEDDADFGVTMLDVLRGLQKARDLSWVDYRTFDVEDHSSALRPERGDMSWLLPGKALALASPWSEPHDQDGLPVCTPALLCPYFLRHGVVLVIQCNSPEREEEGDRRRLLCYHPQSFRDVGIAHLALAFEDGGCPSVELVLQFLAEVEALNGAFAVHCRSGLGRTATLIGIYAIRHLGFTARSFIGWARAMRPGTVHGSQQQYLANLEPYVRPGAARTLDDLDARARLRLLPRRELRFWALDCGIPAIRTRNVREAEMIEMILAVKGGGVPRAPAPVVAKPPVAIPGAAVTRSLAPVLRTQAQVQGTGQLLPKPTGPKLVPSSGTTVATTRPSLPEPAEAKPPAPARSQAAAVADAVVKEVAKAGSPRKADAPGTTPETANRLSSLNAAIASLGRSLHSSSAAVTNGQGAHAAMATGTSASSSTPSSIEGSSADAWAEVLRYLHLHAAMQEGNDAWASVRQTVESLRTESLQALPAAVPSASQPTGENTALSEAHQAAQQQVAENERQLRTLQQQAQSMQRETVQLRAKLLHESGAQLANQAKMEERGEALVSGLQGDELKLEVAVRQVEELRVCVLNRGGLEQQQVDRVEQLRRDIQEARQATLHHSLRCRELRSRLEATPGIGGAARGAGTYAVAAT